MKNRDASAQKLSIEIQYIFIADGLDLADGETRALHGPGEPLHGIRSRDLQLVVDAVEIGAQADAADASHCPAGCPCAVEPSAEDG